ncbi:ras-related protein Rab-17 isoform X1 [Monodon monoceros]|uniref:ras-related protein Rab-17 isoform X1 n=1 Tax=Monodon monoceros TaxID=40151 RepID=UPI0010F7E736|nr:ras-related protein Rab-17 isoform X1 [Monodon monoceros]
MAQVDEAPRPGAALGQACIFKLVLLGSGSVGKSSLALQYVKNDFRSILPTVGCAFFTKVVDLGAASLKFEIWDTAGQEKYHSVCHLYFRGANAALLVYDVTRKASFCKARQWLKDLEEEFHPGEVVVMLVGNKTDLNQEREVTFEVGLQSVIMSPVREWGGTPNTHAHLPTQSYTHTHTHTPHAHTHTYHFSFPPGQRFLVSPGKVSPRGGCSWLRGELRA